MTMDSSRPWIQTATYEGPERRIYSKTPEQLEDDIRQMFVDHETRERDWLEKLKAEVMRAFPDGDVDGHREYHTRKIVAAKAEEEFWKAARAEALKNGMAGIFAVLKWVAILAILGLAYKIGAGPAVAKLLGAA